jgi:hypothetical protein
MKTREEVEKLKEQWKADGCWNIENTEGFEEYHDELLAFRKNYENNQALKKEKRLEILKTKYCPLIKDHCLITGCAWWNENKEMCVIKSISFLKDIACMANTYNQIHQ